VPATKYTYNVADFTSGLNVDRFSDEIRGSSIIIALSHIDVTTPDVDVWFKDALSGGDQTTLTALVAAHPGTPPDDAAFTVNVTINEDVNHTITGVQTYDRLNGGTLVIPSGTSFPGTPVAGELFWRSDLTKLYRRNNGNSAWNESIASMTGVKSGKIIPGSFSGNPKQASVTFAVAFPDTNYSLAAEAVMINNRSYGLRIEDKLATGFTVDLGSNNISDLVEVTWSAIANSE
jgi:hypothetical protein